MSGHDSDESSIILDPKKMFDSLQQLENHTKELIMNIYGFAGGLQQVAHITYEFGFGELIKEAETDINQAGNAVIAVNNAINHACKEVVNDLVKRFAPQGAKSDYSSPPFEHVHFKINPADRVAFSPPIMKDHFTGLLQNISDTALAFYNMYEDVLNTKHFWVGASANRMRHNFKSRVKPEFDKLEEVTKQIIFRGLAHIDQKVKEEAALGVE